MARTRIAWTLKRESGRDMAEEVRIGSSRRQWVGAVVDAVGGFGRQHRCLLAEKRPITEVVGLGLGLARRLNF